MELEESTNLRIGNTIKTTSGKIGVINQLRYSKRSKQLFVFIDKSKHGYKLKYIEPQPISEEYLLSCGFTNQTGSIYKNDFVLEFSESPNEFNFNYVNYGESKQKSFTKLHELENLYFELTQEILTPES